MITKKQKIRLCILTFVLMISLCSCGPSSGRIIGGEYDHLYHFTATIIEKNEKQLIVSCEENLDKITKGTKIKVNIEDISYPNIGEEASPSIPGVEQYKELGPKELKVGNKISIMYFSYHLQGGSQPTCKASSISAVK